MRSVIFIVLDVGLLFFLRGPSFSGPTNSAPAFVVLQVVRTAKIPNN